MMNCQPFPPKDIMFSIIVPTYNRSRIINNSILSILEQKFLNWECLVIDDGSTDNTEDVIEAFGDKRIRYHYKNHGERSAARNYGITRAKGKYICFLDCGDIFFSNHLSVLYDILKEKNFPDGLFHTESKIVYEKNHREESWFINLSNREVITYLVRGKALYINSICASRAVLNKYKFPEKYNYWEDQHLWIRILLNYPFYSVEGVTTQWNIDEKSSVVKNFQVDLLRNLKMNLACITNLEENREVRKSNLIQKEDFLKLKKEKTLVYLGLFIAKGNIKDVFLLYALSLKYIRSWSFTKNFLRELKMKVF